MANTLNPPWPLQERASSIPLYWDEEASLQATTRQGQPLVKIPEDLSRYERIIEETKPDVIIEAGTWRGYSAKWFLRRVPHVITIDIEDNVDPDVKVNAWADGGHFIIGSSTDPLVLLEVELLITKWSAERVMVVLDSDHSYKHVAGELKAFKPLVSHGQYLVVEDGHASFFADFALGGPLEAIEELLETDADFERDTDIETLHPVTLHPAGYWRRK
jgi:cephalosporin hydroxylase